MLPTNPNASQQISVRSERCIGRGRSRAVADGERVEPREIRPEAAVNDAGLRVTISTDNMTLAAVTLEEGTEQVLRLVAQGIRLKDAAREVSAHTGLSKNELYAAALERS